MKKWKTGMAAIWMGGCILLGGCSRFDASVYTQAVLDMSYKNQTERYIEMTETTKQDAERIFQNNLDATMEAFKSEKLSEELEAQYRDLFENIIRQVKYTVGEAQKEKDGSYKIKVAVEPVTLFDDTYETFQTRAEEYARGVTDAVMNGAVMPTEEEIQEQVYKLYYEILQTELENGMKYGKSETVELHIEKTEEGAYRIRKEDLKNLDGKLISRKMLEREMGEEKGEELS